MATTTNIDDWLRDNIQDFQPPVCNKMLENKQLKVMYVGGPVGNQRSDYHIEEGEEIFYQKKGHMVVKIMEQGKPKDVRIEEGEIFLLPSRIPHSPQRYANSMGLVIERERLPEEIDGLRYYTRDDTGNILYEEWFACTDLGVQLKPVITRFFASEQHKTGKPIPGTIQHPPPLQIDVTTVVNPPISLASFLDKNCRNSDQPVALFDKGEFKVHIINTNNAKNYQRPQQPLSEMWVWQIEGTTDLLFKTNISDNKKILLAEGSCVLIGKDEVVEFSACDGLALVLVVDPHAAKQQTHTQKPKKAKIQEDEEDS